MTASPIIRPISLADNPILAEIIRTSLTEFGANKPGTVYFDPTTDALFELFQTPGSAYFVAEIDGFVVGGAGIYPTDQLPNGVAELVKMYLRKEFRGLGYGKILVQHAENFAKNIGYTGVYLESMPELSTALSMYEKLGYEYLKAPMGNSGHTGCELWMYKTLS